MKDFIIYSDFEKAGIYSSIGRFADMKDELNLRVHDKTSDFEFMIKLIRMNPALQGVGERLALKMEIFSDALEAFTKCPEVFSILAKHGKQDEEWVKADTLEKLAKDLVEAGWKRKMPAKKDILRHVPSCPTCGHEVKRKKA